MESKVVTLPPALLRLHRLKISLEGTALNGDAQALSKFLLFYFSNFFSKLFGFIFFIPS